MSAWKQTTKSELRLPLDPLYEFVYRHVGDADTVWTMNRMAEALHCSMRRLRKFEAEGVKVDEADRLAVGLGVHPATIWGPSFYADIEMEFRPFTVVR